MAQWKETGTIEETYKRALEDNLGLSRRFIRQSCINGQLKHCMSGGRYLIYYPNLLDLIKNGTSAENQVEKPYIDEVRKLPENIRSIKKFRLKGGC